MKPEFFSNNTHSKECIELNENTCLEYCICKNCLCHYCQYKNNRNYRKKYLKTYFSQQIFKDEVLEN